MMELVCVVCALKADAKGDVTFTFDESNPLAARTCPVCNSSATVAVDIFKRFAAARATPDKQKPPSGGPKMSSLSEAATPEAALRARAVVDKHIAETTAKLLRDSNKWAAHVAALRAFLLRGNSQLVQANSWWDGYHFYHEHSWSVDAGSHPPDSLDYVCIKLVNKSGAFKEVLLYIEPEDEGFAEVSAEQS